MSLRRAGSPRTTAQPENLFEVLQPHAPQLAGLLAQAAAPNAVVCEGLRIPVRRGAHGAPPLVLSLGLLKLDGREVMALIAVTNEVLREESSCQEAAHKLRNFLDLRPGVVLEVSPNGRDCIEAARRAAPDLVLLDMMLPDMLGTELLVVRSAAYNADPACAPLVRACGRCHRPPACPSRHRPASPDRPAAGAAFSARKQGRRAAPTPRP